MAERIVKSLRPAESASGDAWRIAGWLVLAVDGSRFECPRTTANEEGLGCGAASRRHAGRTSRILPRSDCDGFVSPRRAACRWCWLTNVLDASVLSDEVAREIYQSRWGIEVDFRHLKQTMDFTRLNSRTPATAFNEQRWRLISFWVLQRWAVMPQIAAGLNPRRFSAASARREIREVLS
jgi:hypothetical protein